MGLFRARVGSDHLLLRPQGRRILLQRVLDMIRSQAARGIGKNGPFPAGKTKNPINLRDTSRLMDTARVDTTGSGRSIVFPAPYAQFVNAKYPFDGLTPDAKAVVEAQLQRDLPQYVILEADKK